MSGNARRTGAWALLAVLLGLGACATRSPPTHLYTLSPVSPVSAGPSAGPSVAISAVSVADHLNRPQIVTRTGPYRLEVSEFHHWAGTLDAAIARAMAGNLSRLLASDRVIADPWPAAPGSDFSVSLSVAAFEGSLGGEARLEGHWLLRSAAGGPPQLRAFRASEPVDGPGHEALVAAQSRLLGRLCGEIAEAIGRLEPDG